tara:strand:+ start:432 stop:560 length:129 start_codon:yes stop_codon:yes gene_type:complete
MDKKYPEIKNELGFITNGYYTKTLSSAVKRIFEREFAQLNNQ